MNDDDDRWLEIAGLILDGQPVAWDTMSGRPPDDASADALHLIAEVAELHRAHAGEPVGRWGTLAIREQMGHGTFGDVHRAWDSALASAPDSRRFATTRWSLVLAAADPSSPDARAALATLCETYWRPVYEFIRCTGRSADDARDLTQSFFAQVLERGDLGNARRERGKFRSFLLMAVRHFLGNQMEYAHAKKRAGAFVHVPLEVPSEDGPPPILELASGETPESIFEHRWAITTLDTAMSRLRGEYQAAGRAAVFQELRPFLTTEPDAEYSLAAEALGMTESGVRTAVHRLRRHFGRALRATLAETVETPVEIDGELTYLLEIINRPRPSSSSKQS